MSSETAGVLTPDSALRLRAQAAIRRRKERRVLLSEARKARADASPAAASKPAASPRPPSGPASATASTPRRLKVRRGRLAAKVTMPVGPPARKRPPKPGSAPSTAGAAARKQRRRLAMLRHGQRSAGRDASSSMPSMSSGGRVAPPRIVLTKPSLDEETEALDVGKRLPMRSLRVTDGMVAVLNSIKAGQAVSSSEKLMLRRLKPARLSTIEQYIKRETAALPAQPSFARLRVYSAAFRELLECCPLLAPVLSRVKREYERAILAGGGTLEELSLLQGTYHGTTPGKQFGLHAGHTPDAAPATPFAVAASTSLPSIAPRPPPAERSMLKRVSMEASVSRRSVASSAALSARERTVRWQLPKERPHEIALRARYASPAELAAMLPTTSPTPLPTRSPSPDIDAAFRPPTRAPLVSDRAGAPSPSSAAIGSIATGAAATAMTADGGDGSGSSGGDGLLSDVDVAGWRALQKTMRMLPTLVEDCRSDVEHLLGKLLPTYTAAMHELLRQATTASVQVGLLGVRLWQGFLQLLSRVVTQLFALRSARKDSKPTMMLEYVQLKERLLRLTLQKEMLLHLTSTELECIALRKDVDAMQKQLSAKRSERRSAIVHVDKLRGALNNKTHKSKLTAGPSGRTSLLPSTMRLSAGRGGDSSFASFSSLTSFSSRALLQGGSSRKAGSELALERLKRAQTLLADLSLHMHAGSADAGTQCSDEALSWAAEPLPAKFRFDGASRRAAGEPLVDPLSDPKEAGLTLLTERECLSSLSDIYLSALRHEGTADLRDLVCDYYLARFRLPAFAQLRVSELLLSVSAHSTHSRMRVFLELLDSDASELAWRQDSQFFLYVHARLLQRHPHFRFVEDLHDGSLWTPLTSALAVVSALEGILPLDVVDEAVDVISRQAQDVAYSNRLLGASGVWGIRNRLKMNNVDVVLSYLLGVWQANAKQAVGRLKLLFTCTLTDGSTLMDKQLVSGAALRCPSAALRHLSCAVCPSQQFHRAVRALNPGWNAFASHACFMEARQLCPHISSDCINESTFVRLCVFHGLLASNRLERKFGLLKYGPADIRSDMPSVSFELLEKHWNSNHPRISQLLSLDEGVTLRHDYAYLRGLVNSFEALLEERLLPVKSWLMYRLAMTECLRSERREMFNSIFNVVVFYARWRRKSIGLRLGGRYRR
eukprot:PLAT15258.2.p1 GENE.PLAT15258.2~~PLAT15258.2.p1  ORF type:complete len:1173 (+),score=507.40 PLAT15258.2:27-3545(+)